MDRHYQFDIRETVTVAPHTLNPIITAPRENANMKEVVACGSDSLMLGQSVSEVSMPLPATFSDDSTAGSTKPSSSFLDQVYQCHQIKLDTLERIRQDLTQEGISVPGIVVCGAQSSGKSSLLESITGINFPRAANTCTRCAAIVQLVRKRGLTEPYAQVS